MDSQEAEKQIKQMREFILSEATDKAQEIQKKGEEEFSIEVHKMITEQKEKIRQNYERKTKQIETQYAISKSMAINKQRLEKIKSRQEVMMNVQEDVKLDLANALKKQDVCQSFISQLILQGLLMLLETEVTIRCRQSDVQLVSSCLPAAAEGYCKHIKEKCGVAKQCKLTVDTTTFLPPAPVPGQDKASCLGGVMLLCQGGKITIDNTIDARLALVMEQAKPAIRGLLFPVKN
eukprot:TRINITY_DN99513_c0_g1_i1.p1 TRINITY_DN99513_c0_g1~~TRINITY_DN99513_c0_g1_i1.p1  ORF type:complete len:234 (-),score=62.01 TRINITY_DN99513_c0_g1_i1:120-821(-)